MSTTFLTGLGTLLQIKTGSAFQTIPQVNSVTPPDPKRTELDITNLNSSGTEYGYALVDAAECSFTVTWNPKDSMHNFLLTQAYLQSSSLWPMQIILNNAGGGTGSMLAWNGVITSAKGDAIEPKKDQRYTFMVRPSNGVTFTA